MALIDNCIAAYNLDNDVTDETGSYDGTNVNGTFAAGKINEGLVLNGSNAYLDTNLSSSTLGSGDYSISFWFKVDTISAGEKLFNDWLSSRSLLIQFNTGVIQHYVGSGSSTLSGNNSVSFSDTTSWHHLVATHDVSTKTLKLYLDNATPDSDTYSGTRGTSSNDFLFGSRPGGGDYFDGMVDMLFIWNRVLDASEVSELYNSGDGLEYPFSVTPTTTDNALMFGTEI